MAHNNFSPIIQLPLVNVPNKINAIPISRAIDFFHFALYLLLRDFINDYYRSNC